MSYVVYAKPLPELTIKIVRSAQTFRCVTETDFEVVSSRRLSLDDIAKLSSMGLLGIGQGYSVRDEGPFEALSHGEMRDQRGNVLKEAVPEGTKPYAYTYYRLVVRRVCDSGD